MDFFHPLPSKESAPCPSCGKHTLQDEMICRHCGYEFTANDSRLHNLYIEHQSRKGKILAVKVFSVLFVVLAILYFLWMR